MDAGVVG